MRVLYFWGEVPVKSTVTFQVRLSMSTFTAIRQLWPISWTKEPSGRSWISRDLVEFA